MRAVWRILGAAQSALRLYQPTGIAVDQQGNVYVADAGNDRIVKVTPTGRVVATFGRRGTGPGELSLVASPYVAAASGLALDTLGNLYVSDTLNHRIQEFTPSGTLERIWQLGPRSEPTSLGIDARGTIYVLNSNPETENVVILAPSGRRVHRSYDFQVDPTYRLSPIDLAVAPTGEVVVWLAGGAGTCSGGVCADSAVLYLAAYSAVGHVLFSRDMTQIAEAGPLVLDGAGTIAIAGESTVSSLAKDGQLLHTWNIATGHAWDSPQISGLARDRSGNLYVVDDELSRVIKVSPAGRVLARWGAGGFGSGQLAEPATVAAGPHGHLYVRSSIDEGGTVHDLSAGKKGLATWHVPPGGSARVLCGRSMLGIAVDRQGSVYATTSRGARCRRGVIIKYDASGRQQAVIAATSGNSLFPNSVALAHDGTVYVTVQDDERQIWVEKYSRQGAKLATWKTAVDHFDPVSVAVGPDGSVFVAASGWADEWRRGIVVKFSPSGKPLAIWRGLGAPGGIVSARDGTVYVTDDTHNRVVKFSSAGTRVMSWGGPGSVPGRFHDPSGLAIDGKGRLYVADTGNNCIQELQLPTD